MLNVDGIALVKNAHPHPKRKKLVQYLTSRTFSTTTISCKIEIPSQFEGC